MVDDFNIHVAVKTPSHGHDVLPRYKGARSPARPSACRTDNFFSH